MAQRPVPVNGTRRLRLSLFLIGCAGLVLLTAAYTAFLVDSRDEVWDRATRQLTNTGVLIRQDVARNLEVYNMSLEGVILGLNNPEVMSTAPHVRDMILFDRSASARFLGAMVVLDDKGRVAMSASPLPMAEANFASESFFKVHQASPNTGLFISAPFKSELSDGDWAVALSRRVDGPEGRFGGVVLGALKLAYFKQLFGDVNLGRDGVITLLASDGTVLMRRPADDRVLGVNLASAPAESTSTASNRMFVGSSAVDGIKRYFGFQRIDPFPLTIVVGLSTAELFAAWTDKAVALGAALIAVCLAIIGLTLTLARQLQHREAAERALAALATTDPLSGLANRRVFDEKLADLWHRGKRSGAFCSVLMIDADMFKAYNDLYGHPAGDRVIQAIARCVALAARRTTDVAARYGGEEFVLLLPETDASGAAVVAETLRAAVAALTIPHERNPAGVVTISIGAATAVWRPHQEPAALITRADRALYDAKAAGRNRVAMAPSLESGRDARVTGRAA